MFKIVGGLVEFLLPGTRCVGVAVPYRAIPRTCQNVRSERLISQRQNRPVPPFQNQPLLGDRVFHPPNRALSSRGKRRIHDKPNQMEINACKPWLEGEIEAVKPKIIVALGATAAQGLLGKSFRVTKQRGRIIHVGTYPPVLATVHPSSLLRQTTEQDREWEIQLFIADLKKVTEFVHKFEPK